MYAVSTVCAPSGVTDWNGINLVHSNHNVKRLSVSIAKVNSRVPNRAFGRLEPSVVKIARSGS